MFIHKNKKEIDIEILNKGMSIKNNIEQEVTPNNIEQDNINPIIIENNAVSHRMSPIDITVLIQFLMIVTGIIITVVFHII